HGPEPGHGNLGRVAAARGPRWRADPLTRPGRSGKLEYPCVAFVPALRGVSWLPDPQPGARTRSQGFIIRTWSPSRRFAGSSAKSPHASSRSRLSCLALTPTARPRLRVT